MGSHSSAHERAHEESEPVTDRVHTNSWSANLEEPHHSDDRPLVERHAIQAVEHTAAGYHVNLVTHESHGHPEEYLFDTLAEQFGEDDINWEYIDQCGCGGHVVRVHIE